MTTDRIGKITERRRGDYFLTTAEWPDGHCEIEVHHCSPELLFHSCDPEDLSKVKQQFEQLPVKAKLLLESEAKQ